MPELAFPTWWADPCSPILQRAGNVRVAVCPIPAVTLAEGVNYGRMSGYRNRRYKCLISARRARKITGANTSHIAWIPNNAPDSFYPFQGGLKNTGRSQVIDTHLNTTKYSNSLKAASRAVFDGDTVCSLCGTRSTMS